LFGLGEPADAKGDLVAARPSEWTTGTGRLGDMPKTSGPVEIGFSAF